MMQCGWCGNKTAQAGPGCTTCGGPLPTPGEARLAAPPPPAPRALPAPFPRRERFAPDSGIWVGLIWIAFTGLFPLIFALISVGAPVMLPAAAGSLIFVVPGAVITGLSLRRASRRLSLLRTGHSAVGTISAVDEDRSRTVDDRYPHRLSYLFEVEGQRHAGSVTSIREDLRAFEVGHPIHVIYNPADPDHNDVWPVIAR